MFSVHEDSKVSGRPSQPPSISQCNSFCFGSQNVMSAYLRVRKYVINYKMFPSIVNVGIKSSQ